MMSGAGGGTMVVQLMALCLSCYFLLIVVDLHMDIQESIAFRAVRISIFIFHLPSSFIVIVHRRIASPRLAHSHSLSPFAIGLLYFGPTL